MWCCEQQELLVACDDDGELLGCVEIGLLPPPPTRPGSDVPYMVNLVVVPEARRAGVAKLLIAETEALARSWEHETLYCKVDRNNRAARILYDKCDFKPIFLQTIQRPDWTNRQTQNIFLAKDIAER